MKSINKKRGATTSSYIPYVIFAIVLVLAVFIIDLITPKLRDIAFNGIKIDEKIPEKMKKVVLDADFLYQYNDICINVDENERIVDLRFYETSTYVNGKETFNTISDEDIQCDEQKIESVEDLDRLFGKGKRSSDKYFEIVTYKQDDYTLTVNVKGNHIIGICLKHNVRYGNK